MLGLALTTGVGEIGSCHILAIVSKSNHVELYDTVRDVIVREIITDFHCNDMSIYLGCLIFL